MFRCSLLIVLLSIGGLLSSCGEGDGGTPDPAGTAVEGRDIVELTWWGQAMFVLTTGDGTRVLTDPYGDIGYRLPTSDEVAADVATISHEHPDHNNAELAGDAEVLRGIGELVVNSVDETVNEARIHTIASFHDAVEGAERGPNAIFVIETDGLRIVHMGDIGQAGMTEEQLDMLGDIDVLLMPVGGVFTVDAGGATSIVDQIGPRIVIPMHYGTEALNIGLDPVDAFLEGKEVREIASSTVGMSADALPDSGAVEVWVLDPEGG